MWDKECCGNFLIQGHQTKSQEIWRAGESICVDLAQISIFNSPSSTSFLEVKITGNEQLSLQVYPGNTSTFTGHNVKTIQVSAKEGDHTYIEGKYCVTTSFRLIEDCCDDE
ncbi:S-Ena type endospore appendage [Cohnella abietis]|uniref:Endospore appendages core domain-containing protein n=1 Tax=Cohnella abietis TaxID=2507935 RepID=A0A3T1D1P2_9BACL|nr:S-Ena type endospore appendage [Cohnella abietis]BBI31925.1 hypothetical protein KCTCHS21_13240 [Cohnella abietis]